MLYNNDAAKKAIIEGKISVSKGKLHIPEGKLTIENYEFRDPGGGCSLDVPKIEVKRDGRKKDAVICLSDLLEEAGLEWKNVRIMIEEIK